MIFFLKWINRCWLRSCSFSFFDEVIHFFYASYLKNLLNSSNYFSTILGILKINLYYILFHCILSKSKCNTALLTISYAFKCISSELETWFNIRSSLFDFFFTSSILVAVFHWAQANSVKTKYNASRAFLKWIEIVMNLCVRILQPNFIECCLFSNL